jgi:hypothetical protein
LNFQTACRDYVQFGRDVLFVTNFQSQKYCGLRPKRDLIRKDENEAAEIGKPRLYVEENDREMDIWLTVKMSEDSEEWRPRNLTLVVTVFKPGCGSKDNYFRACPNTQNCVRYLQ